MAKKTTKAGKKAKCKAKAAAKKANAKEQEKKKFVGGAEKKRREAQRRRSQPSKGANGDKSSSKQPKNPFAVPTNIRPNIERFFSCLLASKLKDIANCDNDPEIQKKVIQQVCQRADFPIPSKLPDQFETSTQYYGALGGQIMLESLAKLSSEMSMQRRDRQRRGLNQVTAENLPNIIHLKLMQVEEVFAGGKSNRHKRIALKFQRNTEREYFLSRKNSNHGNIDEQHAKSNMMNIGMCFQLMPARYAEYDHLFPVLASLRPTFAFGSEGSEGQIVSMAIYDNDAMNALPEILINKENTEWLALPITTLIGDSRQFSVCSKRPQVPFLDRVLGMKKATHIKFCDDGSEEITTDVKKESSQLGEMINNDSIEKLKSLYPNIKLPPLNLTQGQIIRKYLEARQSSLSLVQGPPGTGKTTFLVSLLTQYILSNTSEDANISRRVMVAAPSNKAIIVLASRFLQVFNGSEFPCNVVMIGVESKLMAESAGKFDYSTISGSKIEDIFVYSWIETLCGQLGEISNRIKGSFSFFDLRQQILVPLGILQRKIQCQIPDLSGECGVLEHFEGIRGGLERCMFAKGKSDKSLLEGGPKIKLKSNLMEACTMLRLLDGRRVVTELMSTANIIFCTLATAGSSSVVSSPKIDDLFIDEAGQATEGEMIIPFMLKPDRMLAVGDPMQLPATIMSKEAIRYGFDRSLHERLMFSDSSDKLDYEFSMLNVQYRMKAEISTFPSSAFYSNKIQNGENVMCPSYGKNKVLGGNPFLFINVQGTERKHSHTFSYYNEEEASIIVNILKRVRSLSAHGLLWGSPERVRIITFYQGQVSCIRRALYNNGMGNVLVATVDSSQGCEADLVIVSFTRCNAQGNRGFLVDERRLNVSLTRAKYQLICVGDGSGTLSYQKSNISSDETPVICALEKLVHSARERNSFYAPSILHNIS